MEELLEELLEELDGLCGLDKVKEDVKGLINLVKVRELRRELKGRGVETLIAVMAHNPESVRFYKAVEKASIHDEAVWMDLR